MAGLAALALVFGMLWPFLTPARYRSSGRLQMFLRSAPASRQGRLSKQGVANQRELMLGRTFLEDTVARLAPDDRERLLRRAKIRPGKHSASQQAQLVTDAMAPLEVEVEPGTQMLQISFESDDPRLSAAVVNAAMSAADNVGLRLRLEQTARVSGVLRGRLNDLERDIQRSETREEEDGRRMGRVPLGAGQVAATASMSEASLSRAARKLARKTKKSSTRLSTLEESEPAPDILLEAMSRSLNTASLLRRLSDARAGAFAAMLRNGQRQELESQARGADKMELERLRSTLNRGQAETAALAQQLGSAQPALQSARAAEEETEKQLVRADQHLVEAAQAEAGIAKEQEAALRVEVEKQKHISSAEAIARTQDQMPELDLAIDEDLDAVQTEILRGAQVDAALKAFGFYVVDMPKIPQSRAPRRFKRSLLGGALAGLVLVLGSGLFMRLFEREIWHPGEAEQESGLSLVAVLPQTRPADRARRPGPGQGLDRPEVVDSPHGLYASALAELAEKVLAHRQHLAVPVVLLTSATAGEGKSTTAANLAVLLARTGLRVLLVDADLHRPTLHRRFGLSAAFGLSQVLAAQARTHDPHPGLEDAVQPVEGIAGLDLLTAGPPPPHASSLLQSGAMELLLESARNSPRGYHLIMVDAPPALGSSDSPYLASLSDILLFVARYGRVDLRRIRRGAQLLFNHAPPVSGLVINSILTER